MAILSTLKRLVTPFGGATPRPPAAGQSMAPAPVSSISQTPMNLSSYAPAAPASSGFSAPVVPQVKPIAAPAAPATMASPVKPATPAIAPVSGTVAPTESPATPATPAAAATPAMPAMPSAAENAQKMAERMYAESLKLSPEELGTQEDLDRLIESTQKGFRDAQDQAIPMDFITGQIASIERRAVGLAEPLERKLARMQAARTSAIGASKFALERADKSLESERAAAAAARTEAESRRRFDAEDADRDASRDMESEQFNKTFEENRRQFGLQYALDQQKAAATGAGGGAGGNLSEAARNIIDLVNKGADMDSLIKGSSREAQALRNEVYRGLAEQGGRSTNVTDILTEGKSIVDDMLASEDYKAIGGWSTRLGGQWGTKYGDAMAKAQQLSAILARDNLGLLKGAMSDKDLQFIQSMSSGFEGAGIQSEAYIKGRLDAIQTKLANKLGEGTGQNQSVAPQPPQMMLPNGTILTLQSDGTYQ